MNKVFLGKNVLNEGTKEEMSYILFEDSEFLNPTEAVKLEK